MKTYDFDEQIDRCGTGCVKYDQRRVTFGTDDLLPMWVADMDFRTPDCVFDAIRRRMEHPILGYTILPADYFQVAARWINERHGWMPHEEWMGFLPGIVPGLSFAVQVFTEPGDEVVVQPPVYHPFLHSVERNGRTLVFNPLRIVDGRWEMDFDDLERRASDPRVTLMLLCNPHNPACRVWTREELERVGDICLRHGVTVVSDEIHCEFVMPGHAYTPFATLGGEIARRAVSCVSPSKTFNIAGLQIANIVAPDDESRRRIDRAINLNEVCDVNPFGVAATIAAYTEGEPWLLQLLDYIKGNYDFLAAYCREHLPVFPVAELEGTYLAWMDCRATGLTSEELEHRLLAEARLWLNAGSMYGAAGEGFMRWNLACPRARLAEALERFARFVGRLG